MNRLLLLSWVSQQGTQPASENRISTKPVSSLIKMVVNLQVKFALKKFAYYQCFKVRYWLTCVLPFNEMFDNEMFASWYKCIAYTRNSPTCPLVDAAENLALSLPRCHTIVINCVFLSVEIHTLGGKGPVRLLKRSDSLTQLSSCAASELWTLLFLLSLNGLVDGLERRLHTAFKLCLHTEWHIDQLVGRCSTVGAAECKLHGAEYIEWKVFTHCDMFHCDMFVLKRPSLKLHCFPWW